MKLEKDVRAAINKRLEHGSQNHRAIVGGWHLEEMMAKVILGNHTAVIAPRSEQDKMGKDEMKDDMKK